MLSELLPQDWSLTTLAVASAIFVLAGVIKGISGAGLPTVSLALLVLVIDLKQAIALLIVPTFLTNVSQAATGGQFVSMSKRLAWLLIPAAFGIWIGVTVLVGGDAKLLSGILGVVLVFYSIYSLATPQMTPPSPRLDRWLSPPIGFVTGILFGFTGSFLVPGVLYLQAQGFKRDTFVQAMGISFTWVTCVLWVLLWATGLFTFESGLASLGLCVPAFIGLALGTRARMYLNERRFRQVFFGALFLIAVNIIVHAFL